MVEPHGGKIPMDNYEDILMIVSGFEIGGTRLSCQEYLLKVIILATP